MKDNTMSNQLYLKIENEGTCPSRCFSLLGAGLSDTDVDSEIQDLIIGKFHSGGRNSIALLLRKKLSPIIFLSTLKMEFLTEKETITDELASKEIEQIYIKYSGKEENGKTKNNKEPLQITTEFGQVNWVNTEMALREFISNAIDFSLRKFKNWNGVVVEIVTENQVRAKSGYTRVFIPINEDVISFYSNLGKWFLHFSEPESVRSPILKKANRNIGDNRGSVIFRRGVRVKEMVRDNKESMFDYNISDLTIDECRNSDDYTTKYAATRALSSSREKDVVNKYLYAVAEKGNKDYWEFSFEDYYMHLDEKEIWQDSYNKIYGESILTDGKTVERVQRKGYKTLCVDDTLFKILSKIGIKTSNDILTKNELEGLTVLNPTEEAVKTYNGIWKFLERNHLTRNKPQCPIHSFVSITDEGGKMRGFFRDDQIFIGESESGKELFKVILHEISHYVVGSKDEGYDLNLYLLDIIVAMNNDIGE